MTATTAQRYIYTAYRNGESELNLTASQDLARHPDWSPDGQTIVYQRWVPGGEYDIYTMDPGGGNVLPIVEGTVDQHVSGHFTERRADCVPKPGERHGLRPLDRRLDAQHAGSAHVRPGGLRRVPGLAAAIAITPRSAASDEKRV